MDKLHTAFAKTMIAGSNLGAWLAAIGTWKEDLEFWLRIIATIAAIALSVVSIFLQVKKSGVSKKGTADAE